MISFSIGLASGGTDRRSLAHIESAKLDARSIGSTSHLAAQRIDLAHEVPLREPADRWVAAHGGDRVSAACDDAYARAHPSGGKGRLAPGMTGTDYDYVV